jgi:hypothetical protein
VDAAGSLAFLDDHRRIVSRSEPADDVARIESRCSVMPFVLTAESHTSVKQREAVRLRSVVPGATLVDVDEVTFAGSVMALWERPSSRAVTAIVRQADGSRYEAHQISVACAR